MRKTHSDWIQRYATSLEWVFGGQCHFLTEWYWYDNKNYIHDFYLPVFGWWVNPRIFNIKRNPITNFLTTTKKKTDVVGNDENAFSKPHTIQPWKWEVALTA